MSIREQAEKIAVIDAIRGSAAIYVIAFHVAGVFSGAFYFPVIERLLLHGHYAVELFFCVSGFLVYRSLERAIGTDPRWRRNFLIKRFFRIIPLWWVFVLAVYAVRPFPVKTLLIDASMLFGFVSFKSEYLPPLLNPAWSLFVEECFYVLLPFFVLGLIRDPRRTLGWALGAWSVSLAWQSLAALSPLLSGNDFVWHCPLTDFQYFFIGIGLFLLWRMEGFQAFLAAAARGPWLTWLDVFALILFFGQAVGLEFPMELGTPLLFACLMTPSTLLSRLINRGFLRWVGVRCYCIYLVETLVMGYLGLFSRHHDGSILTLLGLRDSIPELQVAVAIALTLAGCMIIAKISELSIERPAIRLGRRLTAL